MIVAFREWLLSVHKPDAWRLTRMRPRCRGGSCATRRPSPERIARYRRGRAVGVGGGRGAAGAGYRILARRVRTPYGEIDLIAVRGRRLAFVEVKRRATRLEAEAAHHPAPGRPHRPGGRVLGQPPRGLPRARAGPRRHAGRAGPPAGAPARCPAGHCRRIQRNLALTRLAGNSLHSAAAVAP